MSYRIAVVGSRHNISWRQVVEYITSLPQDTIVVSGGAQGVDTWAEKVAQDRGLQVDIYPVIHPLEGFAHKGEFRAAAMARNQDIVNNADKVTVFWDGSSKGSLATLHMARKENKPVSIFFPNGYCIELCK